MSFSDIPSSFASCQPFSISMHVLTLIQYEMVAILSKSSLQTQRVATPRGAGRVVTR